VTTPFDDPQAELAWMFLQNLSADGDLDEGFSLLSDDFTYWNNTIRKTLDKTGLRKASERIKASMEINFDLLSCLNEGQNVVIEAQPHGVTEAGVRYDSPIVFLFQTHDGMITSLREYGDTRLMAEAFGDLISPGADAPNPGLLP
jgi:ketosteroid isomerase-like protein